MACARTLVHQRHAQTEPVLQLMVHIHCGRVHNVVANGLGSARRSTKSTKADLSSSSLLHSTDAGLMQDGVTRVRASGALSHPARK